MPVLLIEVHLLEPLWHGAVDWPPSPFRLFQALVAGAYGGRWVGEDDDAKKQRTEALEWLERQNPPDIAFPPRSRFRRVTSFVPNNDIDSVGGDLNKVPDIRAEKTLMPWRIENGDSFLYAWTFDHGNEHAKLICSLAERLYRFGRGLDGAWAVAKVLATAYAETLLRSRGAVSRPCGQSQPGLRCPAPDSLDSLVRRHEAAASRFKWDAVTRKFLFRQAPKPIYCTISYDFPGTRLWFEIRQSNDLGRFHPISQAKVVSLTEEVRDRAARRLLDAMPESRLQTERFLTGRSASPDDISRRIRIVALPSIGHPQTSPAIRRVGVLIPPDCPIPAGDIAWAFSGLPIFGVGANTLDHALGVLVQTAAPEMAYQYGFDRPAKLWRSVTPIALPQPIPYARLGSKRAEFETQAASAVVQACRHAGIVPRPAEIRVQIEPFLLRGEPAHVYAAERFSGRLRHTEITFERPVQGPLLIGDGRFLGLGLMQPVFDRSPGLHVFSVEGARPLTVQDTSRVLRALRRAVMTRAQDVIGRNRTLPIMFHGHDTNGSPARSGNHAHLFFAAYASGGEAQINRVAIIAPDFCDRTAKTARYWETLACALEELQSLVCGSRGEIHLAPVSDNSDRVFGLSRFWRSVTPYRTTRHPKRALSVPDFIASDLKAECVRRSLPIPQMVEVTDIRKGPRDSLSAQLTLSFKSSVRGPLLLGRGSHLGEGLFTGV
jgi:CRISPR-associated protein Csb2